MERNESVAKVEKANHEGGLEAAYKAFDAEVNQIASSSSYSDADAKILEMTGQLEKDGLLPGLSAYWAMNQKPLMNGDMKFDRQELGDYVDGRKYDKTSFALGGALKADFGRMNDNYWQLIDLTGDNKLMGSMDLITEMAKAEGLRKESANKDNAMKLADELKRDPALFDSLANLDGNGESLSGWDVMFAHGALNLNDRMGKQVFTPEQITLLKNHNWDTLKELAKAQDLTKADLENVPKYEKHPWETEDSLESDNKEKAKSEAEAREEAVQEKAKLEAAKITGKKIVDATVELGAAVGEKLGAGLAAVGDMITDQLPPTDQISKYYIESGQGFDRIARDVLRREASRAKGSEVREFDEADVVALSSEIAKFNGMQRQDILRMDQESLNIPPINWAQISAS